MPEKPKFALIIRTPPPPDYMRFNETLYADRTISELIPQWRNQVQWCVRIHDLPKSPDELKGIINSEVVEYRKKYPSIYGKEVFEYDFNKTIISEFTDTEGHKGILVQVFD